MSIFDRFRKKSIVTKEPAVPYLFNYGQAVPPDRDTRGYINAFGEVGWLFAVISKIAQGVADADWGLYTFNKGEYKEVDNHPILDVLEFVNPFQTRQEFIELHEIYMGLVGECFWVINKNKGGLPGEIWIASPDRMSVVPSKKDFIAGYVYQVGSEKIPLDKEIVIHHKLPNPANPYRGLGPVQALAIDLDSEYYAGKWNRNWFYNSAKPDGILSFEQLSDEQYQRLKQQWNEKYRGTANAHKMALVEGAAKYQQISISAKDMDFHALRLLNRDNILGVFGMPLSVMGITENVNRANAEAGDYTFARWIVTPRLKRLQGKLNEQFIPMFPNSHNLILMPDDVVPESIEENRMLAESGIKTGYMKINEARELVGLESLGDEGDVLVTPNQNPFGSMGLSVKKKRELSLEWKETYWRGYVTRAETYEKRMIEALKGMFDHQESQAIQRLENGSKTLIDQFEAKIAYTKLATPILTDLFKLSIDNGRELIKPKPVHTEAAPEDEPLNDSARKWLLTRIGWAAEQVGEETARKLAAALAVGYGEGESIPDLAKRIREVFVDCDRRRSILIARTETLSASAQGAIEGYKEADLEKAEFMASMDERLCEDCEAMDNETFTLDDCQGILPLHPSCRCCWLPVV
ncbi:MAG: phage portal protein [Dehalococcoidales bacterium]|nr:phage portal protein [Dehalococcoidales bacterium]